MLVLLTAASAGCIRPARAIRELPPGQWTHRFGNAANSPFLDERVPNSVTIAWNADVGRGLEVAPIVQDDLIIAVVSGGGVVTMKTEDGSRYWSRRFNGAVAGQLVRADSQIYFATRYRNGTAYALDLSRGRRLWSRELDAPAAAQAAFADGRIYVGTNRDVQALDATTGEIAWRQRIGGAPAQPPIVVDDELLIAVRDTLFRLARADGTILDRIPLAGEPSAPLAMRGDTVVIAMHPGIIAAYAEHGAREVWHHAVHAPVLAAPVLTDDGIFLLTRDAELLDVGPHGVRSVIRLEGAATESLTITADGALIGTLDGRIVHIGRNGQIVWEVQLDGSVRAPAVVHDSEIYVATLDGRLVKLTGE